MRDDGAGTLLARTLVGRDTDLLALQDAWRRGGTTRVVAGPAGIGKTRLVRELTSWALAQGGVVLTGRCSATSQEAPLRPLREALLTASRNGLRPSASLEAFVPSLARLVPEWGDADVGPAAPDSALVLGEAVLRLLMDNARGGPTATLVIDDLQWADPESLTVLEYVADNLADTPVLLVATVRDDAPGPGAEMAAALLRRRAAVELALDPLSPDDVLTLASSCLTGASLPPQVAPALIERCEGIPFLVEELLATGMRSGWDTVAADVPGSVTASVAARLDSLPAPARPLVQAAALLGRQFDWTIATTAAGLDETAGVDLLRQMARAQLIEVDGPGFRFRHTLTRDAVLAGAAPAERAVLARRARTALEALDPALSGERCVLAAELALTAGDTADAAARLIQAARRAVDDGALGSADALATRALAIAPASQRPDAEELLLRVCALAGQTERAEELGQRLLGTGGDPDAHAEVHVMLGTVDLAAGRWRSAADHARDARALVPEEHPLTARADVVAAHAAMGQHDVDGALALAAGALARARQTGQPDVQCEALEVVGRVERGRDLRAAEAAFAEAHSIATNAGLPLWQVRALQELGTIDMYDTLATERLLEARATAARLGALSIVAVIDLQLSAVYDERGDLDLGLAAAARCEEASRRWQLATFPMSLAMQAMLHARAGRRADMDTAIAAAYATGEDRANVHAGVTGNAEAVYHVITGDLEAARRHADEAMAGLRERSDGVFPFPGMWALLRTLLDEDGAAARAEVAALPVDAPVSRQMLVAAEAVAIGRAGDGAVAAARFADADGQLARQQGGFRRGLLRLLVAPAAHADGWGDPVTWLRETLAAVEAQGLDALAGRCRVLLREVGAPVPRRGRGDSGAVPPTLAALGITSREVDVLALVAGGATNRAVAEQLSISTRTVDKHVERLLQKTGTSRAGLAEVARAAGVLRT